MVLNPTNVCLKEHSVHIKIRQADAMLLNFAMLCSLSTFSSNILRQNFECYVTALGFHIPFVPWIAAERNGYKK